MLLGEETSGNHQERPPRHHSLNEIRAAKECSRNSELRTYLNRNSSTLFLKVGKLDNLEIEAGRQFQILGPW